ncbi:MAG TPA: hypothetical protein DEF04_02115 [Clostridiales bacterium]|nr:hypothetical protein [Clostridiales bacterium]
MEKNKWFCILKILTLSILFILAAYFENAQQQRLFTLILVFSLLIANNILKYFVNEKRRFYFVLFAVDLALIYILETNSRLLINYFLHSFYIIILFEAAVTLEIKHGIIIGIADVLVSMVKFIYLTYFRFNLSSISQMVFFFTISILILIVAIFAQYNRQEKEKKDMLYSELLDAHKKLKEYTDEVQRLSAVEERNRIARDIHDNLGHSMTALIMQLQMAEHYLITDSPKSQELIADSVKAAKDNLSGIREVVETLRGTGQHTSLADALRGLAGKFSESTGTVIDLKIEGTMPDNQKIFNATYHILQESMTNAVRHGKASEIMAEINYFDDVVRFIIRDDGTGTDNITEGYGMRGIRERVKELNGDVEFKSENGFIVSGYLRK